MVGRVERRERKELGEAVEDLRVSSPCVDFVTEQRLSRWSITESEKWMSAASRAAVSSCRRRRRRGGYSRRWLPRGKRSMKAMPLKANGGE